MSLVEDIDVTGALGGGGRVVSCRFGAAGDATGKAFGGRAIGKCRRDDGEDENLENEVLEGEHFDWFWGLGIYLFVSCGEITFGLELIVD